MPVDCLVEMRPCAGEEFSELDYRVMRCAFESQNKLGRLADETIYQADVGNRLEEIGLEVAREVSVLVSFAEFSKTYYLDLVVSGAAVYEFKACQRITPEHDAQLLNYLFLLDCRHGKLINFRNPSVESRFVNAPISAKERRSFEIQIGGWEGEKSLCEQVVNLIRDWGTGLELPLYRAAVAHLAGGEKTLKRLQITRGKTNLGTQAFHLIGIDAALHLTALESPSAKHEIHLRRLIDASPLNRFHWIYIARRQVTFKTVS